MYRSLRRDDRMEKIIFRSIVNFHFGLTEKILNLQLTKRIIDRKFPTFYVPLYPYKTYIFHCYETFSGTCLKKFPIVSKVLRFLGFPVTKVSPRCHQGSQCVTWSCKKCDFSIRWMQYLQFGFSEISYIFIHTKHLWKFQHTRDFEKIVLNSFGQCNI